MAFRASSRATDSGADLTLDKPAGTTTGDVIIIAHQGRSNPANGTWTFPSGFTQLTRGVFNDQDKEIAVAWKIADGSEGSTFSISAPTWEYSAGCCLVFSGRADTSPVETYSKTADSPTEASAPTGIVVSTVTPTAGADLVLIGCARETYSFTEGAGYGPPSGFTERVDVSADYAHIYAATADGVSAGATGSKTALCVDTAKGLATIGYLISLSAAGGGSIVTAEPGQGLLVVTNDLGGYYL